MTVINLIQFPQFIIFYNLFSSFKLLQLKQTLSSIMNLFKRLHNLYGPFKLKAQFFIQTMLRRKSYLAIGFAAIYVPMFYFSMRQHEKESSIWISKHAESASQWEIPQFMRSVVFGAYAKYYNVDTEQMTRPIASYKTFTQFFTRTVKQRPVPKQQNALLSPCDSRVLSFGQITQDSVFVVKGYSYSLGHLLCGEDVKFTQQQLNQIKKNKQNKLYHVVLYLSPGDYHRFHSMAGFEVVRRKVIEGALLAVNEKTLKTKPKVYEQNSRLILHGKWKEGYLAMILVGALNVGRIVVKDKVMFEKGEEIGYFNLGSTIVLLVESPNIDWKIAEKEKVKYNQIIGMVQK